MSSERLWLAALVLSMGCGAAGPPAGPKHVPSNTEEAATACPKERKSAQEAREGLLGSEKPALSVRAEVAAKVLAHGDCEAEAAGAMPVPAGSQDEILAGIRTIRLAVRDASNLYSEVRGYDAGAATAVALLADADLTLSFATTLGKIEAPSELEARAAIEFRQELDGARGTLREQAELVLRQALVSDGSDSITERACQRLGLMGASAPTCL